MAIVLQDYNNTDTVKFELISRSWVAQLRSNAAELDNTGKMRAEGQHQSHTEEVEFAGGQHATAGGWGWGVQHCNISSPIFVEYFVSYKYSSLT